MQDVTTISQLSDAELDAVSGGNGRSSFFGQGAVGNLALGIQIAPTVNIALFSGGVYQSGATQGQLVNAGNIALIGHGGGGMPA